MFSRILPSVILSVFVLGLPLAIAYASPRHVVHSGRAWSELRCADDRSPVRVSVSVTPFVHDDGYWQLWVANDTAWNYGNWAGNALSRSTRPDAGGYICAKGGDLLKINGSFSGGDMYLVYRKSSTRSGADQITDVRIGERSYDIGNGCWWSGNGVGGYDMMCRIR